MQTTTHGKKRLMLFRKGKRPLVLYHSHPDSTMNSLLATRSSRLATSLLPFPACSLKLAARSFSRLTSDVSRLTSHLSRLTSHVSRLYLHSTPQWKLACLFIPLLLSLSGFAQTLSLSLKNAPLETAFRAIEARVPQRFVYTTEMLAQSRPVTIRLRNAPLQQALSRLFENQPLDFSLDDAFIKVRFKAAPPAPLPPALEIYGKVFSEKGEPLDGATVLVKGKNTATATSSHGDFFLKDVAENDILIISHVGYSTKEIPLNGRTTLAIYLGLAVTALDETVVVAYGTTTKRRSTASIGRITADDIGRQPVSNPLAALPGRIAGLNITQGSGLPGANFTVLIRGRNSIQNGTAPLYIIDGVPFLNDADRLTQLSQVNANSPFNTLNPTDILSIEVLKDADATAIYGSRGANGVILITTKKGTAGKTAVDLNVYSGWGRTTHAAGYMNTRQYLQMRREAFANDSTTPTNSKAPDLLLWDTTRYTNWKKELIGGTANTTNTQLRVSGGSGGTTFSLSANYYRESTVFPGTAHLSRKTAGLSLNHHDPNNRLALSLQASYGSNYSHLYQQDLTQYINTVPNAPAPYDFLGNLNWRENGASFSNPLANILRTYNTTTDRLTGNTTLAYRIGKFLLKTSLGYNTVTVDETTRFPIESQNPSFNPKGSAGFAASTAKTWIAEPQIEYSSTFGNNGSLQSLLGATWQQTLTNTSDIRASGYTNDFLLNATTGAASLTTTAYRDLAYRYQSVFGRTTLNWDKKYLLNLTYRRDASSRFGPGKQYANFGAAGAGWIFSGEKWMARSLPFLSFGKLRGSYGLTGNDQIGDYQFLDTWSGTTYPYGGLAGLYPTRITNPYYSWEQKKNLELALDLGLFTNKVLLTVNWFRSTSDNQIIRYTLPAQTGSNNILKNFPGKVLNKGWEVEANASLITNKNLSWKTGLNLTLPKNKLLSFPGLQSSSYANTYIEGEPLSILIGYRFLGVDPATGVYQYDDRNHDGLLNTADYTLIGTTDPQYYGGWQNIVQWKSLEWQCFFQVVKQNGRDLVYGNSQRYGQQFNQPTQVTNHWSRPGDAVPYQKYTQQASSAAYKAAGLITSSGAVLTDASFIRLKNMSLSYTLPPKWMNSLNLQKGRAFAEAQNLWTITPYKGSDPESQNRLTLPPLRMIALGIQLTF